MLRALNAAQSRAIEERAVAEHGVTLAALMDSAGQAIARELSLRVPEGRVVVVCGPGNNGGDGWVAARELAAAGRDVVVLALRDPDGLGMLAAEAARSAIAAGVEWRVCDGAPCDADFADASAVVDAILGVGSTLPLREPISHWAEAVNRSGAFVLSVDLPTGVDSDSGAADDDAIVADCTVSFTTPKLGLVMFPAASRAGEIVVADIGVDRATAEVEGAPEVWTSAEYGALVPLPAPDAHKNSRGRLLIVGGSGTFAGAAVLAARGAMRMGAGYVTVAVPEPIVPIVQSHLTAAPVVGLPSSRGKALSSSAAASIRHLASDYDAIVLGPGLTLADGAVATVRSLVASLSQPIVLDADGLNAFVDAVELITERPAPLVLTPHPGELSRLLGVSVPAVQMDRVSSSARLASANRAVVLKGAGTIVSGEGRSVIVTSGSPALATAGTGDVLAGMIGALLAQGLSPFQAGALGAYVHGRAGEAAASELTTMCMNAEDLPDFLPVAVGEILNEW